MPLSVPFSFGTAGLATPTSRLDADYTAITDYINARNPTVGPIALRPATGNVGAIYVASDQANRTYVDDGALWQEISSAVPTIPVEVPTGASMLFNMDAAPVGWTRDNNAAYNDRVVRIVTGSRVHGGSWFVSGFLAANHSHTGVDHLHGVTGVDHLHNMPSHAHSVPGFQTAIVDLLEIQAGSGGGWAATARSPGAHTHPIQAHNTSAGGSATTGASDRSLNSSTGGADRSLNVGFTQPAVSNDASWRPLSRDVIVCTKD